MHTPVRNESKQTTAQFPLWHLPLHCPSTRWRNFWGIILIPGPFRIQSDNQFWIILDLFYVRVIYVWGNTLTRKFELGNTHLKPVNLKFWRRNGWWRDASAKHHAPRRNADWAKESCAQEVTLFLRPQPSNFLAIKEELRLFCAESVISERFFAAQDWLCKVDSATFCSSINLVLLLQLRLSWFWTAILSKGMLNLSSKVTQVRELFNATIVKIR